MNQRIKELAEQAHQGYPSQTEFLERFANYIIGQCIFEIVNTGNKGVTLDQMIYANDALVRIEKRFGYSREKYAKYESEFVRMKENAA
jgi:hypothetical protein